MLGDLRMMSLSQMLRAYIRYTARPSSHDLTIRKMYTEIMPVAIR